jgi:hypothetical protein
MIGATEASKWALRVNSAKIIAPRRVLDREFRHIEIRKVPDRMDLYNSYQ